MQVEKTDAHASLIAQLLALCLVVGFFVFFQMNSQLLQELSFLALGVPASLMVRYGLANVALAHRTFFLSLVYLIPISLSFLLGFFHNGRGDFQNAVILLNLYFVFYVGALFASGPKGLWKSMMRLVALFSLPLFAYVSITQQHAYRWERWEPFDLQPNWWGMMALGFAWGALLAKDIKIRIIGFGSAFMFMVALQSRGSIVALLPAFFLSSGLFVPLSKKRFVWLGIASIALLFVSIGASFVLEKGFLGLVFDYIAKDVFLVDDPYRGAGTGLTGRTEGYLLAWDAFTNSPIWGGGFGEYGFVHNGFLLVLAEGGLLAFSGMLFLMGRAFIQFYRKRDWVSLGFFLSYVAAIMTFPRSFNINMTGIAFIILLMRGNMPLGLKQKPFRPLI